MLVSIGVMAGAVVGPAAAVVQRIEEKKEEEKKDEDIPVDWGRRIIGGRRRIVYLGEITSAQLVYYRKYVINLVLNEGRHLSTLSKLRKKVDDCTKNS